LDLGADEFTVGRPHPMIDQDLRIRRLKQEAADPEVGMVLLDVVLGEGSHADPAGELAPAVSEALARDDLEVVALVVGTDEDPQDLEKQVGALEEAGAKVFRTTEETIAHVATRLHSAVADTPVPVASDGGPLRGYQCRLGDLLRQPGGSGSARGAGRVAATGAGKRKAGGDPGQDEGMTATG
jgi:hypothetical protein